MRSYEIIFPIPATWGKPYLSLRMKGQGNRSQADLWPSWDRIAEPWSNPCRVKLGRSIHIHPSVHPSVHPSQRCMASIHFYTIHQAMHIYASEFFIICIYIYFYHYTIYTHRHCTPYFHKRYGWCLWSFACWVDWFQFMYSQHWRFPWNL